MIHGGNYLINFIIAFDVSSQASGAGDHTHSYEVTAGNIPQWKRCFKFLLEEYLSLIANKARVFPTPMLSRY